MIINTQLPNLPVPLQEFTLENDVFVRITTLSAKHELDREVTQLFTSKSFAPYLIKDLHASPYAGHSGKVGYLSGQIRIILAYNAQK